MYVILGSAIMSWCMEIRYLSVAILICREWKSNTFSEERKHCRPLHIYGESSYDNVSAVIG